MLCSYCDKEIIGKPPYSGYLSELTSWDGSRTEVVEPERRLFFCSDTCQWRFWIEEEKLWGRTDKEARQHLIEMHGLTPPANPQDPLDLPHPS